MRVLRIEWNTIWDMAALRNHPVDVLKAVGRRERSKADKRARILAAARELLARKGYDGMTMADVARHADVAAGTVFQYAATKPELLMMATAERCRAIIPGLLADVAQEPEAGAAILKLLRPFAEASLGDETTALAVARELIFGAQGEQRAAVLELVGDVEAAIADRIPGDRPRAEAAARLIVSGSLVELNRARATGEGAAGVEARLVKLVALVLAGAGR